MNTNEITSLTPQEAAKLVNENKEFLLYLDGLTSLIPEVAIELAKHKGWLSFDGLTSLSVETARELVKHDSGLYLDGITELSVEVARELAKHNSWLRLDGLTSLSPEVAHTLVGADWNFFLFNIGFNRKDKALYLRGLGIISDETKHELQNAPFVVIR